MIQGQLKKTILVVDDEDDVRDSVCIALRSVGYEVDGARTGKDALSKVVQQKYDAAILDVRMPEMTGFDVLHAMRKLSPDTIVIMLTAMADPESQYKELTRKAGAFEYMKKPCKMREIRTVLENAFDKQEAMKRPQEPEPEIVHGIVPDTVPGIVPDDD